MQRKDTIPSDGDGDSAVAATNGGGGGGSHPACASCKHQRKKCAEDCILAAVFPAEKTREFQAVHKVFGVSNVIKMMRRVEARDRERVAESLIWEAASRENDPVLGALRQFQRLQEEKQQLEKEHNGHQMVRPQGHGGGVMYNKQAPPPPLPGSWSSNGGSNGVSGNGKVVNGNGHTNNILQGSFPTLHNTNNNSNSNHHGKMINNNNKVEEPAAVSSFKARQSPQPLPQQHLLHHQQPPPFHHPQFYQLDLPVPGN
ncbi:unnamed protein product [Linum tenue]|uniref:LOB domain-containing protein n=1 Tax=Linum tenue TaxID=586396 RepID=A0AAV0NR36_9ROSI|nr:unnamed protein product [Linum tenue]